MTVQKILYQQIANTGGIAGQVLIANSTGVTWGDANNAAYLGGTAAASYQTTAGLSANVATLTSNNTSYVGTVTAANVVSNAQLSSNLANYALLSGATFTGNLNVSSIINANNLLLQGDGTNAYIRPTNVNSYLYLGSNNTNQITIAPTGNFGIGNTGPSDRLSVNGTTYHQGNVILGSSSVAVGLQANGVYGSSGQVLTSNGTATYWAAVAAVTNVASQYAWTNTQSFSAVVTHTANVSVNGAIIANGGAGTSGQVLTSSAGGNVYWSTVSGGGGGFSNGQSISVANLVITGSLTANASVGTAGQALVSTGTGVQWGAVSPGYNYSSRFDGSSYLTSATAAVPSTGTFTVEFWMYTSLSTIQIFYSQYTTTDANRWEINIDNSTGYKLSVSHGVAATLFGATVVPLNQWNHVAVVRDASNNLKIYLNGVLDATAASYTYTLGQTASRISGFNNTPAYNFTGYISNLRVTNTAVYTAAFTPPTTALSAISGTTLLVCNAITPTSESSSGAVGITNNGAVTTTATLSPFTSTTVSIPTASLTSVNQSFTGDGTTTTFSVAGGYTPNAISVYYNGLRLRNGSDVTVTNGSTIVFAVAPLSGVLIDVIGTVPTTYSSITPVSYSVGFNGSTQYLSIADSAVLQPGSSNFTAESWVFLTASPPGNGATIISKANASTIGPFWLGINSSYQLSGLASTDGSSWAVVLTGPTISLNTWYHFALVRNGSTFTLYVNGVSVASTTNASALYAGSTYAVMIGKGNYTISNFTGYISNLRYVVGTAVYTGAFTPPTSPLAAVQSASGAYIQAITGTQTSLLTCNAPTIIDGSTNAFTITNNGSAPVSTSVVPTFTNVTINNTSGSGGLSLAATQTANLTATAGYIYPINTSSGPIYVTLPASPTAGQQIAISDYAGTFGSNNCIINPNGSKISGSTANTVLNTSREGASIVYVDSTQGWLGYGNFIATPVGGTYIVSYLIAAGGGGGGNGATSAANGGGGGAGGLLTGNTTLARGITYPITVGAGGAAGGTGTGSNSSAVSLVAAGGGNGATGSPSTNGQPGGSGGGQGGGSSTVGSGTAGQGNAGGTSSGAYFGGGGGAGAAGGTGNSLGGVGLASTITGTSVYYAGGGGGGSDAITGTGGNGGGGNGGGVSTAGSVGSINTGGGGGGGGSQGSLAGAAGGSGVVILSVPTVNYTGITTGSPTVTTSGSNTIIKFTASGSYTA